MLHILTFGCVCVCVSVRPCVQSPHGLPLRHSSSPKFAVKTRQAFYLQTTGLTRMARRLCQDIIRPQFLARHPYLPVNTAAIKAECNHLKIYDTHLSFVIFPKLFSPLVSAGALRLPDSPKKPSSVKPVKRKPLEAVVRYLGETVCLRSSFSPPSLLMFPLHPPPSTSTVAHPRPAKPDPPARGGSISTGSLTPIKSSPILNNGSPTILGKRTYEQHNGLDGE